MKHFFGIEPLKRFLAKRTATLRVVQPVIVFALGAFVCWLWLRSEVPATTNATNGAAHQHDAEAAQMWTCAMHPQIQKNKPGLCPLCQMDLIPVKVGKGQMTGLRQLSVSPEARALMNIQVAPVERRYVTTRVRMVGKVDYDETRLKYVTAWVPGRLDRLFVDYTGVEIKQGDHMVYIYSEELYTAQQELIEALKSSRRRGTEKSFFNTGGVNLLESVREKLRLLGLTKQQIAEIETLDKPSDHMMIHSPISGIVIQKLKQEGDRVNVGDQIYAIADLSEVWVKMDAYESDLVWVRYGQQVTFTTEAYPGEEFIGRIAFIDPVLNKKSRTVKVRVNVPNPHGKLKPEMFVRAVVKTNVAAGGRVMDPDLAGKWISPMHPEIVKDQPGTCDICGMPLVRAETFGYETPKATVRSKPLVIPAAAAMVTGTRAIVYVELPSQPHGLQDAYQALAGAIEVGKMPDVRSAFASVERTLTQPKGDTATEHARQLWTGILAPLKAEAAKGRTADQLKQAEEVFAGLAKKMERVRDHFAQPGQPTFEGREIVLGPRAGDYYLVKRGLQEGELIVAHGNFKIDAEIQIQAKPSMMTPGGGGGGGHDHGGHGGGKSSQTAGQPAAAIDLSVTVLRQLRDLNAAYKDVATVVKAGKLEEIRAKFDSLGKILETVESDLLAGHRKMLWDELSMLLSNDVMEGRNVKQPEDARRVFQSLRKTMRRVDAQFSLSHAAHIPQRLEVPSRFQSQLGRVWDAYAAMGGSLARDDFATARKSVAAVSAAVAIIDVKLLKEPQTHQVWMKEVANIRKILKDMSQAAGLKTLRGLFEPLSGEMQVLVLTFGVGDDIPVYQLHCPMAFGNKGAIWLQKDDQVRNPYFGSTMLKCADRVELISGSPVPGPKHREEHQKHE